MTTLDRTFIAPVSAPVNIADVEDAIEGAIRADIPAWAADGGWAEPRSWEIASENLAEFLGGPGLPAIVVSSGGTEDFAESDGPGQWSGTWIIETVAFVSATDSRASRRLLHNYATAIRAIVVRGGNFGIPEVGKVDLRGESYSLLDVVDRRTIMGASLTWRVRINGIVDLASPTPADPDPLGVIDRVCEIDVNPVTEVSE